jgi:aryl-alcohol dehydrogenase-like predicted oxidoreductase
MKYQKNQKNGLSLSQVGLGCMRLSPSHGMKADKSEGIRTIHAALDAGINFFNTGDFYSMGLNEMLVDEAL